MRSCLIELSFEQLKRILAGDLGATNLEQMVRALGMHPCLALPKVDTASLSKIVMAYALSLEH